MATHPSFNQVRKKFASACWELRAEQFVALAYRILFNIERDFISLIRARVQVPRAQCHHDRLMSATAETLEQFLISQDEPMRAMQLLHAIDKQLVSMYLKRNSDTDPIFESGFSKYVPEDQSVIGFPKTEEKLVGSIYDITPQDIAERLRKWLAQVNEAYPLHADIAEIIAEVKKYEKQEEEQRIRAIEENRRRKEEMQRAREAEERKRKREAKSSGFGRLVLSVNVAVGAFLAIGIVSGWFTIGDIIGSVFR